jgi:hypothetical protein
MIEENVSDPGRDNFEATISRQLLTKINCSHHMLMAEREVSNIQIQEYVAHSATEPAVNLKLNFCSTTGYSLYVLK